ncbi:MAG: hypothetical protein OEN23_15660 [Paracoccaceae bacterium]|nr:hypothetical protein [Paracoccaceae bacterium]
MVDAVKIARGRQAELASENRRLSDFIGMAEMLVKDGRLVATETSVSGAEVAEDADDETDELVLPQTAAPAAAAAEGPLLAQRLGADEKAASLRGSTARESATTRDAAARDAARDAAAREPKTTTARGKALFLRAHP